ncbi:DNA repair protein endonuclease SAE2/CtIP C-terminus-domain-containing protein [Scleroderma yunnanense]
MDGHGSSNNVSSLVEQVNKLQEELDALRKRYNELKEAKERAALRYKADYRKWKTFKQWYIDDLDRDEEVRRTLKRDEWAAYNRASTLGKRQRFEVFGPHLDNSSDDGSGKENSRDSKPRRRYSHTDMGDKVPSMPKNEDPPPLPETGTNRDISTDNDHLCDSKDSRTTPPDTNARKRRGRYAQIPSAEIPTINSRFSINKDHNRGLDFQYDTVVRDQEERRHMLGSDCECCHEYYKAVGRVPVPQRPLWQSPKRNTAAHAHHLHDKGNEKENADDIEQHKQRISRHRHHWYRSKTPPAYWEIGFPDTQEASEINRRAAEMHKRKLVDVETDARSSKGRYLERDAWIP